MNTIKRFQKILNLSFLFFSLQSMAQPGVNSFPGMGLTGFHVFMVLVFVLLFIYGMYLMIKKWKWTGLLMVGVIFLMLIILLRWALTF